MIPVFFAQTMAARSTLQNLSLQEHCFHHLMMHFLSKNHQDCSASSFAVPRKEADTTRKVADTDTPFADLRKVQPCSEDHLRRHLREQKPGKHNHGSQPLLSQNVSTLDDLKNGGFSGLQMLQDTSQYPDPMSHELKCLWR